MSDLSLFDLEGRVALVTGGAMGIGRTCAFALAKAGAEVVIADLNEELGQKAASSIEAFGRASFFVRCDVTDANSVQRAVDESVRQCGRLDIAVNNAGIFRDGADEIQSPDDWRQVLDVNLTGIWLCARSEMQQMIRQVPTEGKIINIASIAATTSCSNGSYDASKAAVVQLTRTLAARWGRYNINVNSLSPGYVGTVFGRSRTERERAQLRAVTPLGYVQRLEDLRGPLVFLASKASDYATGQNLIVDGGHTLSTWIVPLERSLPPRVDIAGELAELDDA